MNAKRQTDEVERWPRRRCRSLQAIQQLTTEGHFQWRHLVFVAVITGVVQGAVSFGCAVFYITQFRSSDCCFAATRTDGTFADRLTIRNRSSAPVFTIDSSSGVDLSHESASRVRRASTGDRPRKTAARTNGGKRQDKNRDQSRDVAAVGIHLELSVPSIEQHVTDRLYSDNRSTETVEYGQISSRGFRPYPDRSNGTAKYSFRNWTPAKWFNSSSKVFQYEANRGRIKILLPGLYYVYSQIRFYHTTQWSYALMLNENILFKCLDGTAGGEPLWQYNNCYIGGITALAENDQLWLMDMYGETSDLYEHYVHLDPVALGASSFWGVVRFGHL